MEPYRVGILAQELNVSPRRIVSCLWQEFGIRKSVKSLLSNKEVVQLRRLLRGPQAPSSRGTGARSDAPLPVEPVSSATKSVGPLNKGKTPLEILCEKHGVPLEAVQPNSPNNSNNYPQLQPGWKKHLNPRDSAHMKTRPRRVVVHLKRGVEGFIWLPAAYILKGTYYFLGETLPELIRPSSRPGNFIMSPSGERSRRVVVKRVLMEGGPVYLMAYADHGIRQALALDDQAWSPCPYFAENEELWGDL